MPTIVLNTSIAAPLERCFDLARSVEFHLASTPGSAEQVVGPIKSGLLGLGDEVTWRARHLGATRRLTSRIVAYQRPIHFRDSQVRGPFRSFDHDHEFLRMSAQTLMTDRFRFAAPFGPLGRLVERLILTRYLTRVLRERGRLLKAAAESEEWRKYLSAG